MPELEDLGSRNVVELQSIDLASGDYVPVFHRATNTVRRIPATEFMDGGDVTNAAVVSAVEEDPAAVRTAAGAAHFADVRKLRRRVVSTRMFLDTLAGTNLSVQTRTFEFQIKATDDVHSPQFIWANQANGVAMTIKASFYIGSTLYPLHFNGSRTAQLTPSGMITSDPIGLRIAKGTTVTVRTFADAGSGNVIKPNGAQFTSGFGGTWTGGSTGVADYTDNASAPGTEVATYFGVVPYAMVGLCNNPCLLVLGDSISAGSSPAGLFSWQRENFGSSSVNSVHVGLNANICAIFAAGESASAWGNYWLKRRMIPFGDVAIVAYGTNDSGGSVATIQANLQTVWNEIAALGIPVWACTIPPYTSSTDGFVTVDNQTNIRPNINTVNDWIRTLPPPLTGVIEVSDALSSARNSGKWKAGFTSDGIHPNATGQVPLRSILPSGLLSY